MTSLPSTMKRNPAAAPSRGFWPMRDLPTALWFLVIVVVAFTHRWLPMPTWLLLHLLFLGAASHAILVWSQHFTAALSRSPVSHRQRAQQNIRLMLANVGMLAVFIGVPWGLWPLTLAGSIMLVTAVAWHGVSIWLKFRGALPGRFTGILKYYILAAACLPIGVFLGAWMAHPEGSAANLKLAHSIINVLGWIGITVAGTLVTLWPTMLRTKAAEGAALGAKRALPLLGIGVLLAALGAATAYPVLIVFGLLGYAGGLIIIGICLIREARTTAPRTFATLSAGAALAWWIVCLLIVLIAAAQSALGGGVLPNGADLMPVQQAFDWVVPYFAAGFVAQILLGALSYLVPVVIGGGPTPVRIGTTVFDRLGNLRVALANTALFVCILPLPSLVLVIASILYLLATATFIPLLCIALWEQGRAKREGASLDTSNPATSRRGRIAPEGERAHGRRAGQAVAGLIIVLLSVAIVTPFDTGVQRPIAALDQIGIFGLSNSSGTQPNIGAENAPTKTVKVEARDMRFFPDTIEVPAGTRLIIELSNTDNAQIHDLIFANGVTGSRLAPGENETIDIGVITADLEGWCSIIGHRQMGMTLDIIVTGTVPGTKPNNGSATGNGDHLNNGSTQSPSAAELIDLSRLPGADFTPFDATLDPLPPAKGPQTHHITLPVTEQVVEVAPGVRQKLWTFGGSAPGPIFHGRIGDTFVVTLENDGTIGHSIDFHAGALAPNEPMRTIAPGESLTYTFTATRSGIWLYHCSTAPMSAHIANGMYGAVVIEDPELPAVDRSYIFVQGEYYLGAQDAEVDMNRLQQERPDLVTFNGYADQYAYAPLAVRVGERVRLWVLNAGPNRASSFHVIGGQFDTVWFEGGYLINRSEKSGSQALGLQAAQGGFVELVFPEAGDYPFVTHIMIDAERGAKGIFAVK
ncbi:MAG: multicopper oxidase domain-containing protein [Microbacteriaceae bacterium]